MNLKFTFLQYISLCIPLWIVCESSALIEDILAQEMMDGSVNDIFHEQSEEEEGRFLNFYRETAFNNTIAFTMPIISFTLPGAAQLADTGIEVNSFGVMTFTALFVIGALALAIYTTDEGSNEDGAVVLRSFGHSDYFDSRILSNVYDSLFELLDVLYIESCTQLCVCSAHAEPEKYGMLSSFFREFVQFRKNESDKRNSSEYERAAIVGSKDPDECYEEYPCLIQPLDVFMHLKDYFTSKT